METHKIKAIHNALGYNYAKKAELDLYKKIKAKSFCHVIYSYSQK